MKLFTFTISLLLVSLVNFAQSPACPGYFRRNNGNGACADGQLRLFYTICPTTAPIIDSVYIDGVKSNVVFSLPDASKCTNGGYIGYCVIGGNMPPASNWNIYFKTTGAVDPLGCVVPEGGPLPIILNNFIAKRSGGSVQLNWQTSYETNGQSIEIQRKSGNGFVTVGTVAATNNISGSSYSFIDKNNLATVSEYRLKLISRDAEAHYSEIRSVKGMSASLDFSVFPNPAVRNAKISINDITDPVDVQVVDNTGRVVKTLSFKTNNTIEINDLQVGIYRIRIINKTSGESITKSLTVIQ